MRIPLKQLQLHNPLFLAGTNLGTKLDISKRELTLVYDREFQEVHIYFNSQLSIIPSPSVSDMCPVDPSLFPIEIPVPRAVTKPQAPKTPVKAQASSPLDHVFAPAAGKTKD